MAEQIERRSGKRLKFQWPLWYGFEENGEFFQAQIGDLSKHGVSMLVDSHVAPAVGVDILIRFSYPISDAPFFNMGRYFQWAKIVRTQTNEHGNKTTIGMTLNHPLKQSLPIEFCQDYAMTTA